MEESEMLSNEVNHSRNTALLSAFPEKARPLLMLYLRGDGLHFSNSIYWQNFKLLTYDCSFDFVFPYTIVGSIKNILRIVKEMYVQ